MRKNVFATGIFLMASVLLSGCADWERHMQSRLPEPAPAYADKQITVAQTRSVHEVSYADKSTRLSPDERAYLENFLNTVVNEPGRIVLVEQPGRKSERLARQRAESLAAWLSGEGYRVGRYEAGAGESGKVRVAVDHLLALGPNCPNWDFHKYDTFGSNTSPNHGCADRTNLAAMVANPRDLVSGEVPSLPVGKAALEGEIRYRNDQVRPLVDAGSVATN